ncbi:hypothetical protein [Tunicatimonas pelagia]|uniref:hypothetical protein n=1 Tax=Tunicatimonas pelagia TaxID=931531 RepID=UPI00266670B6|nr:hypothetical protein [Tunicatimonas pelagia]WKN45960.1 hypothetical protein P0M28_13430 [Tunicatimonas pelagia]
MVSPTGTYLALIFILASLTYSAIGQDANSGYEIDAIKGSRFLYDDFLPGTVYFDNKTKFTNIPMRLNLYHDELQYINNDSIYAFATPNRFDSVTIGGEAFIYLDESNNLDLSGFVRIWNSQFPAIVTKMSVGLSVPLRFDRKDDQHYLIRSESDIVMVKSVEHLIYLLCYHSLELEEFAKQEKISSTNGAELAWLVERYREVYQ